MRKIICIIIALVAIFALSSCGEVQVTTDVTDIAVQTQATEEPVPEKTEAPVPDEATTDDVEEVPADIDLTKVSGIVAVSQLTNMKNEPDGYLGQTMKVRGRVVCKHDDVLGADVFECVVQDALRCCTQRVEFVMADGLEYPGDDTTAVLLGVFEEYTMEGFADPFFRLSGTQVVQ